MTLEVAICAVVNLAPGQSFWRSPNLFRRSVLYSNAILQTGKKMKNVLVFAGVAALMLSACSKQEVPVPVVPPAPKVDAAAPAPAAPMSDEDKAKAMDAAKAA